MRSSSFDGVLRLAGLAWGLAGVFWLLGAAVYRLTPLALEGLAMPLSSHHWALLAANVVFMAYAEGYRGFQQRFSPRLAARTKFLYENPRLPYVLLAPFFLMAFCHASRRRLAGSYGLAVAIVVLVLLVQHLEQPWRGILDAGVVVGLGWGLLSIAWFLVQAFTSARFDVPHEVR